MSNPTIPHKILIIGTGELGSALINALLNHQPYNPAHHEITILVRPSTLSNPNSPSADTLSTFKSQGVKLLPGDISNDSESALTSTFIPYDTIIHASGTHIPAGTQMKIARAAIAASEFFSSSASSTSSSSATEPTSVKRKLFIPWQFGIDYDLIGPDAGNGLFREAYAVRQLIRSHAQSHASTFSWLIVSCGIFMSLLFEEYWGVVMPTPESTGVDRSRDREDGDLQEEKTGWTVTALGSLDQRTSVTSVEDIGKCTAELLLRDTQVVNQVVYIASETFTFAGLADVVQRVTGQKVERRVLSTSQLRKEAEADSEAKLKQYQLVFGSDVGLAWGVDDMKTYTRGGKRKELGLMGIEEWMRRNWVDGKSAGFNVIR